MAEQTFHDGSALLKVYGYITMVFLSILKRTTLITSCLLPLRTGGGRVVRRCWVNFQCRGVLQF